MSVDIHWETLTSGPDGEQLAETVRAFIHEKFQQISLPRFLRSVRVHSFDIGSMPPDILIKDICDPLPDFYDEQEDGYSSQNDDCQAGASDGEPEPHPASGLSNASASRKPTADTALEDRDGQTLQNASSTHIASGKTLPRLPSQIGDQQPASPLFTNLPTPGIPGGTSNLNYFHLPFGPGLSGTATPLAAVAGAHFHAGSRDSNVNQRTSNLSQNEETHSNTPASTSDPSSRPQSQHQTVADLEATNPAIDEGSIGLNLHDAETYNRDVNPNDIQVVAHVKYAGDLRLCLTTEILLDYPMPSFVGIPMQLKITGLRFDGIGILAYIKKRAHVCFLSPEDAAAFVDDPIASESPDSDSNSARDNGFGGLLEEIRVESEIGEKDSGKQVLKNVGKVEKFILEQVRRIFEEEFVYPSFWTFLV